MELVGRQQTNGIDRNRQLRLSNLKRPSKTTYKLKEDLDVSGGEITYGETGETPIPLTREMTSGFQSDKKN